MNRSSKILNAKQHSGSVLVTVLVIAIIIVLVLMWQAGIFSGASTNSTTNADGATSSLQSSRSAVASAGTTTAAREATQAAAAAAPLNPIVRAENGKDDASISALANSLMVAHPVNLNGCRAAADAATALTCAQTAQADTFDAIFNDYNARRAAGNIAARSRGGEVMKRVIAAREKQLQPFVEAAQ